MSVIEIVCVVLGMLLGGLGSYLYLTNRNVEYILTEDIKGIVTQAEEKPVKAKDKKGNEITGIDHLTYFKIDIDGESYETARITRNKYIQGQTIELKCDPENRRNVEEADSVPPNAKLAGTAIMLIGLALLVMGLMVL